MTSELDSALHRLLCDDGSPPLAYSSDLNAAHQMEAELQRRGLEMDYQDQLWQVLDCHYPDAAGATVIIGLWPLFHATAEQRCKAAIATLARPSRWTGIATAHR